MIVLYIIMSLIVGVIVTTKTARNANTKRVHGVSRKEFDALSWPSQQIMIKYSALPAVNRPFPNIYNIARSLDVKHRGSDINKHFSSKEYVNGTRKNVPKIDCCYGSRRNDYWCHDYHTLVKSIDGIQNALTEQAHALELAGVSGGLQDAVLLTERMREEQNLIRNVTKELQ